MYSGHDDKSLPKNLIFVIERTLIRITMQTTLNTNMYVLHTHEVNIFNFRVFGQVYLCCLLQNSFQMLGKWVKSNRKRSSWSLWNEFLILYNIEDGIGWNRLINQAIKESRNQSINQSINRSINRSSVSWNVWVNSNTVKKKIHAKVSIQHIFC